MGSVLIRAFFVFLFGLSLFGCRGKFKHGHYEGMIYLKTPTKRLKEPVSLVVNRHKKRFNIQVLNGQKSPITLLEVEQLNRHSAKIRIDAFGNESFSMDQITKKINLKGMSCYTSDQTIKMEFCFDSLDFQFQFLDPNQNRLLKLTGSQFEEEPPFLLEKPVTLKLSQAIAIAFKYNYQSRFALEHTIQSKYTAVAAFLNLFPHLTANLIWNAQPSFVTVIATLQGLTPFLLPNYWIKAFEASIDARIKQDTLRIIRANLASNVEELVYHLKRDQQIYLAHQKHLDEIKAKNPNDSSIPSVQSNLISIKKVLDEEKYAIANNLGYLNPEAIIDIIIDQEELPIEDAVPLKPFAVAEKAADRSFEIRQLAFMIKIATLKGVELGFEWIDPTGDPSRSLGLNTIAQSIVAHSNIKELKENKGQIQKQIFENVYRLVNEYNQALENFHRPESTNQTLLNIIQHETNLALFRVTRAKLERLLLSGAFFRTLLPHLTEFEMDTDDLNLKSNTLAL